MSRRVAAISLALLFLLSSEVWALGLGDIRLDSALGEPLRAEIDLLSATPDELDNLTIALASAETFERYGLDRPRYLQDIDFYVMRSGRTSGNVVQLRSRSAMAEPFLTFLVEATWSRGRLLREYTVFLDPPTFAPPAADTAPAVQAPTRPQPSDAGQIQRPAPTPTPEPAPAPQQQQPVPVALEPAQTQAPAEPEPMPTPAEAEPKPMPPVENTPFDTTAGDAYYVDSGQTLWGIASRVRPDSRLSMNQTMLAIFEANRDAFGDNINILRAGAWLRIPSADEIFQIDRSSATAEAKRHHADWGGGAAVSDDDTESRPSLTLVPPDEDYLDEPAPTEIGTVDEPLTREQEIEQRIADLEAADVPPQQSLIEIRDNELAALREELANLRGEFYEPPADDLVTDEAEPAGEEVDPFVEDADVVADTAADESEAAADAAEPAPTTIIQSPTRRAKEGLVDRVMGILSEWWMYIAGGLVLLGGALFWFLRRGAGDDYEEDALQPLDSGDMDETVAAIPGISATDGEEAIVVTEQESVPSVPIHEETIESPVADVEAVLASGASGTFDSFEDTFSSETAINLDQTDPLAEADFHMAYGLYDQAADLVNTALESDPEREDLLTKLCEVHFVWGNRDAFVDAASRLKAAVGEQDSEDWNKIVIMGRQIAADSDLFTGASATVMTKAVDLAFDADAAETGALDMELIADAEAGDDIVDVGIEDADETAALAAGGADDNIDFVVDSDSDSDAGVDIDITREMEMTSGTTRLPALDEATVEAIEEGSPAADETAEINLDDLGLDVDDLTAMEEVDAAGEISGFLETGLNETLGDPLGLTPASPDVDTDLTKVSDDETGLIQEADDGLLDATGVTQVLGSEVTADTVADDIAALDDGDEVADIDFAKTEALPRDALAEEGSLDETGEMPDLAGADIDFDLDSLADDPLVGDAFADTLEQPRDDAVVEQPDLSVSPDDTGSSTVAIDPAELSDDLHDARTMTEVGTKLDLARAYVDMGDPGGARSILEEVLDEGDEAQRQQAQQILDSLPG